MITTILLTTGSFSNHSHSSTLPWDYMIQACLHSSFVEKETEKWKQGLWKRVFNVLSLLGIIVHEGWGKKDPIPKVPCCSLTGDRSTSSQEPPFASSAVPLWEVVLYLGWRFRLWLKNCHHLPRNPSVHLPVAFPSLFCPFLPVSSVA